jgi:nitrogen fixation NifU-like protein
MDSDLRDLYQEVILDHNKNPRNFKVPESPHRSRDGHNPLCGDRITVHVVLAGETVTEIGFQGSGCAISRASASIMTTLVKGKTRTEIDEIFKIFHSLVTRAPGVEADEDDLGALAVFSHVADYPARVKCASLSWHTLMAALKGDDQPVTTE